jgi:hypothetical protein
MKKVLLSVAVATTFAFTSCGGVSVCDCVKMSEEMMKDIEAAGDDESKYADIEKKYKAKGEACEKLADGKSDEEKKKMMEEMMNCK